MASPFSLEKGGVGREEYAKLIAENQKRYPNDRDKAVRSANIAAGFGSSTAQRYLHSGGGAKKAAGGGGGGGGGKPDKTRTAATPAAKAPMQGPPIPPSPDLAVSPPRGDMMWPGATAASPLPPTPNPPMNPALSQASILQTPPPDLTGGGGPDFGLLGQHGGVLPILPSPGSGGGLRRPAPRQLVSSPYGPTTAPGGFNPGAIFQTAPQDPNEPWWKAILRG